MFDYMSFLILLVLYKNIILVNHVVTGKIESIFDMKKCW